MPKHYRVVETKPDGTEGQVGSIVAEPAEVGKQYRQARQHGSPDARIQERDVSEWRDVENQGVKK